MRRSLSTLLLLLPLAAAGQVVPGGNDAEAARLLGQQPGSWQTTGTTTPLWRAPDGRTLAVHTDDNPAPTAPLSLRPLDSSRLITSGLQYDLGPRLQAHADVSGQAWLNSTESCGSSVSTRTDLCSTPGAPPRIVGSEVGATFRGDAYSLGVGIGSARPSSSNPVLPRVVPGLSTASGLPLGVFASSTELNAFGRVNFDGRNGIDLGASVGRIRLLPGNLLGVGSIDQKALSFGVERGPVSGSITGRTMQPEAAAINGLNSDRRWSSIDLGVTWHLPWRGALSVGAQNVWSSGNAPTPAAGPEPDQGRTPYVQYHQDL
ncbi:hypothetical protein EC912_10263 [Luteibacter rhizovicinus]|uniref:Uncharacterized protein n=1 Tax=Luteibacter rhizovicinus TaxID=242606 RepID=A0A4V2W4G2_9GAMM|nr:hypothetical protein [Luteibacter rhizovicinus]TCV95719.1 hypothetical protein EC912_10263 [Luteibacter rhizovicinus]